MKKRLILKYIVLYLPFIIGIGLYSFGIYNLTSSLLLFLGGYISLKNTLDYRKVKKRINSIESHYIVKEEKNISKTGEKIIGLKRTIRYPKVRKRIKH